MSATAQAVFALGAGVATFFSPCVYALLPGYVSYYVARVDSESAPLVGSLTRGLAASGGAIGTFAVLSAVALIAGGILEAILPALEYLIGGALVVLGVFVVYKESASVTVPLPERQESVLGFGLFGAMYALAATACVLPLFLSVSIVSFDLSLAGTTLVLGSYAGSFAALMLAATVMAAIGQEALLSRFAGHAGTLATVSGVVLVLAGLVQLGMAAGFEPSAAL